MTGILASGVAPAPQPGAATPWTDMNPASPPTGRSFPALAYDSRADRVVMFGGVVMGPLNDTWVYDPSGNTWTNVSPPLSPPARWSASMVYDSRWDRIVMFGGYAAGEGSDTWAYDVATNTWQDLAPAVEPSGRAFAPMVYDSQSDRIVLFGGYTASGPVNDTWIYDPAANTWTKVNPTHAPSVREYEAMAYDSLADRIVLFGGWNETAYRLFNDTWTYDVATATWTNMSAANAPSPRSYLTMDYDTRVDRTILFGGDTYALGVNDTWSYDFEGNRWTNVTPVVSPPIAVNRNLVYDSLANRTILFEGDTNGSPETGTWSFEHPAVPPSPVGPFLFASPGNGKVSLAWLAPAVDGGAPVTNYTIHRGLRAASETRVATVGDVLTYVDSGLANGVTYWYSVAAVNAVGEGLRSADRPAMPIQPGDTVAPSVSFDLGTANVSALPSMPGNWTIRGTASDDVAVAEVLLSTDDLNWTPANGTTSWSGNVSFHVGENRIYAKAVDPSGNENIGELDVTIQGPPAPPAPSGPPPPAGPAIWIWALAAANVGAIAAAVFVLVRVQRKKKDETFPKGP